MRRLTIKLKITLWFTVFMVILSASVFAFIAMLSNSTASYHIRGMLTGRVDDNVREVEFDDGEIDIDDDFISFRNGIYCLVLDGGGAKISGYAPYAELESQPFEDGSIRSVIVHGETYLVYDRLASSSKYTDLWVRGVVLAANSAMNWSSVYQASFIALPLLVLLAVVGGYLLAGRSLRPIRKISQTAEDIGSSGDLSKRIELDGGNDELHQLAAAFNRMFERLETNFKAERSFTSDASHELRTPVTTILAQCEYAFENAAGELELYEAIGAIQKQGYRMSHLIESLLQFTRMEQRTEAMTFEIIDLSGLVLSVCSEQKENIGQYIEKKIRLSSQEIQSGIQMKADLMLIARMLENLIKNAYRYGRENGNIYVSLKEDDAAITLTVADDGIGIAPDQLPQIWNRFYRVDKSRSTSKQTGLGLGLAMVKQIAELHGGKVKAESEFGQGSVFTVIFIKNQKQKIIGENICL